MDKWQEIEEGEVVRMKSSSSKAKGRRVVQELKAAILEAFPQLQPDDIQLVPTSVGGEDLKLSPSARACWPYSTECKCQEKLNVWAALKQAEGNARWPYPYNVVFRRNRTELHVVLRLKDFLGLLK